ncbi:hypothetical protein IWX64_003374 [Arthrobacter sp. CAN_A212]
MAPNRPGRHGPQLLSGEIFALTSDISLFHKPPQISTGDYVRIGGSWHQVARVNQKTVSLITEYSWTQKADYAQVRDHRTQEEAAAAAAATEPVS